MTTTEHTAALYTPTHTQIDNLKTLFLCENWAKTCANPRSADTLKGWEGAVLGSNLLQVTKLQHQVTF